VLFNNNQILLFPTAWTNPCTVCREKDHVWSGTSKSVYIQDCTVSKHRTESCLLPGTCQCVSISILIIHVFNKGSYLTLKTIFHKDLNLFSLIVKSPLNPFLELTSTKQ